ncbi:hypothetical protein BDQ17DRAFT_1218387, partial [Cyathus striatus]
SQFELNLFAMPPRTALTQCLLGLGEMPPPTPAEIAVVHLNKALDSNEFSEPWQHTTPQVPEDADEAAQWYPQPPAVDIPDPPLAPSRRLNVHIQVPSTRKNDPSVTTIVPFKIDKITSEEFLQAVCDVLRTTRTTAKLGWKSCDDKDRAPYNRLETTDDVQQAFETHRAKLDSRRRMKEVYMRVVNLNPKATESTKPDPKPSESAVKSSVLEWVKGHFRCRTCPGAVRYCFVRQDQGFEGKHEALTEGELVLWAREITNGNADPDLKQPPNINGLDHLLSSKSVRQDPVSKSSKNMSPEIHVHIDSSILSPQQGNTDSLDGSLSRQNMGKRGRTNDYSDDSGSDSELDAIPIDSLIDFLHKRVPDFDFPKYRTALKENSIFYVHSALDFEKTFYIGDVHMPIAAAGEFLRGAKSLVAKEERKARHA